MDAKISVIIPAYNIEAHLGNAIESVLAQTYENIEIIVVNDGSSDGTGTVAEKLAAGFSNVRVIHQENGGVTAARLRGVAEAKGEWIGFVDGDDEIEPDMCERLLRNATAHDADISHCGYQIIFPDGRVHFFHNSAKLEEHDRVTALRELLSGENIEPSLCNKIFRRELFNGFEIETDILINEDLLMNYYLFSAAKTAVYEDWCPYHYLVRDSSASQAKLNERKIYDPIRVKDIIRRVSAQELQKDAQRAYVNTCINIYNMLIVDGGTYREDISKVRGLLIEEKATFHLLGRKRKLIAHFIAGMPSMYAPLYRFYCRFVRKSVYT